MLAPSKLDSYLGLLYLKKKKKTVEFFYIFFFKIEKTKTLKDLEGGQKASCLSSSLPSRYEGHILSVRDVLHAAEGQNTSDDICHLAPYPGAQDSNLG